ncbi:MAG: hypothetical protein GY863_01515 [bacterium]|nr:hypothetical protein [bacterium]
MELLINKSQKISKKGILGGEKKLRLSLDIEAELADDEYELLEKYYEPEIIIYKYLDEDDDEVEEIIEKIKELIDDSRTSFFMSNFRISAESGDGVLDISLLEKIIGAAENGLNRELKKLRKLESWDGEETKKI